MTSDREPGSVLEPDTDDAAVDCLDGGHLPVDVYEIDPTNAAGCPNPVAGWCLWCGTGRSDPARVDDDGQPIGFTPIFRVRTETGFHRTST